MDSVSPQLQLVVPVYTEASFVGPASAELCRGLEERTLDYELIFAENGSTDSTQQTLQELSRSNDRIRVFHSEQPNYGAALKQGILQARGELVISDEIDLCDLTFYASPLPIFKHRSVDMVLRSKPANCPI